MMAAAMCGTMPSVQPKAATTLARDPRESPAARVNSTPVPGETITMSEVMRNSRVTIHLRANALMPQTLAYLLYSGQSSPVPIVRRGGEAFDFSRAAANAKNLELPAVWHVIKYVTS